MKTVSPPGNVNLASFQSGSVTALKPITLSSCNAVHANDERSLTPRTLFAGGRQERNEDEEY
jgi:hypothetical protein